MPKLSDTMTEGTLVKWRKKAGDSVEIGEVIAEVETDKATMEMESFDEGILYKVLVEPGAKVQIGKRIAILLEGGETPPIDDSSESAVTPSTTSVAEVIKSNETTTKIVQPAGLTSSGARIKASPLAKKIAKARGVPLSGIQGSGPGGRILARDIPEQGAGGVAAVVSTGVAVIQPDAIAGPSTKIALSGMRRVIAERLLASKTQIPHFYLDVEIDAEPISSLSKQFNSVTEATGGPKITVNDFVLLAVAKAAALIPEVNAAFGGDAIIQFQSINLAVAVAVEDGLVTPVIRNAQNLSLQQISEAVKDLASRARNKKLKPEEYQGGTITVSNLGAFGVERFAAIINPPQAAIISVGAIVKKPIVNEKDEIVPGVRMSVALSCDHRVIDGAVGANFLKAIRDRLEQPEMMLF